MLERGPRRRKPTSNNTERPDQAKSVGVEKAKGIGIDGDPQRPTQTPPGETSARGADQGAQDASMEDLAGAMSALQFIPSSVRFGRGGRKAGFAKR